MKFASAQPISEAQRLAEQAAERARLRPALNLKLIRDRAAPSQDYNRAATPREIAIARRITAERD